MISYSLDEVSGGGGGKMIHYSLDEVSGGVGGKMIRYSLDEVISKLFLTLRER